MNLYFKLCYDTKSPESKVGVPPSLFIKYIESILNIFYRLKCLTQLIHKDEHFEYSPHGNLLRQYFSIIGHMYNNFHNGICYQFGLEVVLRCNNPKTFLFRNLHSIILKKIFQDYIKKQLSLRIDLELLLAECLSGLAVIKTKFLQASAKTDQTGPHNYHTDPTNKCKNLNSLFVKYFIVLKCSKYEGRLLVWLYKFPI